MKAKDFFARAWSAVINFLGDVVFQLTVNPFSMFVFNLLAPKKAAKFVRESSWFDDFWRDFYIGCALKWPIMWSKYWITLENLCTCGTKKQIAYYWAHRTQGEVLRAMSAPAQVALVRQHPEWIDYIDGQMRLTDKMFAEWMKHIVKEEHKPHPYVGHWHRVYASLSDHLKTGKLPFYQVKILAQTAVAEYGNSASPLMDLLKDYIERFGLSKAQLNEIAEYMCEHLYWRDSFGEEPVTEMAKEFEHQKKFNHFFNMLNERQVNYDQRVFTRSQRGSKQPDEWKSFCEKTRYICAAAQKEMDMEQYKVFHATGHTLDAVAIDNFLIYPDCKLHRLVFRYEPIEAFEKGDIKEFVARNVHLRSVLEEEIAKRKSDKEVSN